MERYNGRQSGRASSESGQVSSTVTTNSAQLEGAKEEDQPSESRGRTALGGKGKSQAKEARRAHYRRDSTGEQEHEAQAGYNAERPTRGRSKDQIWFMVSSVSRPSGRTSHAHQPRSISGPTPWNSAVGTRARDTQVKVPPIYRPSGRTCRTPTVRTVATGRDTGRGRNNTQASISESGRRGAETTAPGYREPAQASRLCPQS